MIKHLLWDLDGTLFDTYSAFTAAFLATCADWGHFPEHKFVHSLAEVSLTHCVITLAKIYQQTEEVVEQGFSQHYAAIPYPQQPLMPGALALCAYIRSLGGKNVLVTHRGISSTLGLLEAHDLKPMFEDLIAGNDNYPKKPDPSSMLTILARNGLIATEVLAIGDRQLDIAAGQAAGIRTCLLGQLEMEIQPDFQVDHLETLLEIIQQEHQTG